MSLPLFMCYVFCSLFLSHTPSADYHHCIFDVAERIAYTCSLPPPLPLPVFNYRRVASLSLGAVRRRGAGGGLLKQNGWMGPEMSSRDDWKARWLGGVGEGLETNYLLEEKK